MFLSLFSVDYNKIRPSHYLTL